jgi:hypothetical protein
MAKVKSEARICFALSWYDDEAEAVAEGAKVRATGRTVNGGYFHGMPCDRAPEFDHTDESGRKLYAVRG